MSAIYIVCFLALTVGIVLVLGLTPEQLTYDLAGLFQRRKSLREQSLNARGKKKSRRIAVAMQNIRTALEETGKGKQFSVALAASGLLFVVGCAVAIAIGNPFLISIRFRIRCVFMRKSRTPLPAPKLPSGTVWTDGSTEAHTASHSSGTAAGDRFFPMFSM